MRSVGTKKKRLPHNGGPRKGLWTTPDTKGFIHFVSIPVLPDVSNSVLSKHQAAVFHAFLMMRFPDTAMNHEHVAEVRGGAGYLVTNASFWYHKDLAERRVGTCL